jgi:FkbM family methyltransferase
VKATTENAAANRVSLETREGSIEPGERFDIIVANISGLARHGEGTFREIVVKCQRLDEMTDDLPTIDFVKIDVEGAELYVLRVPFGPRSGPGSWPEATLVSRSI